MGMYVLLPTVMLCLVVLSVLPHSLLKVGFPGSVNASHIVYPPVLIPVSLDKVADKVVSISHPGGFRK